MNTIRQILKIDDNGTIEHKQVDIDVNTFSSLDSKHVIGSMLKTAFLNRAIKITQASANPLETSENVIINGRCSFVLGSTLLTTLTLSLDSDGNIQALFKFTLIEETPGNKPWKFSDSFSNLPVLFDYENLNKKQTSPLDSLLMFNTAFLVSTYDTNYLKADIKPGINFYSDIRVSKIFSVFEILLSQLGQLSITGIINLPSATSPLTPALLPGQYPWQLSYTPPGINLELVFDLDPLVLGTAMTLKADKFHIYSPASVEWMEKHPRFVPVVAFGGEIDIPSAAAKVEMLALSPMGTGEVEVIADFNKSKLLSLDKLADITGVSGLLTALPAEIQHISTGLGSLQIMQAGVILGLKNKAPEVLQTSVAIGMPDINWEIWKPYFKVESITGRFIVQSPFRKPELDIVIKGEVDIAETPFTIIAEKNEGYQAMVSLAEKVNLPLQSLMKKYVEGIPPPSDLTIDALTLTIAPGKFYSLILMMAEKPNPWVVDIGIVTLTFNDIELFVLKPQGGDLSGTFSAKSTLADLQLSARYDIPGDILIQAELPAIKLSTIISSLISEPVKFPDGFDLDFTQSYIMMKKAGTDYRFELGTVIEEFGSLAFVLEKSTSGWGIAAGLEISTAQMSKLKGVGSFVADFQSWFPFDTFVLALSSLTDSSFSFPGFKQFNNSALGRSKITLPATVQGINKGFYLYTNTTFTRKNKILGAMIDILGIAEGTQLQAMLAFLVSEDKFQLAVSVTTFLTPLKDINQRSCQGELGYRNTCLIGTLFIDTGGSNGFTFGMSATVKTQIQNTDVDFNITLGLMANGIFISGTMDNKKPLDFGPIKLADIALELGISFEGIPSFGFSAQIDVANTFDSSIAVLVDANNPANSMLAGGVSNINLRDIVEKLLGKLEEDVPAELMDVLATVGLKGTKTGEFCVSEQQTPDFITALDNFDGSTISQVFTHDGKQLSFPSSSEGLMLFVDTPGSKWYITEKGGAGASSTITHWQLSKNTRGEICVSKEAQFYFVPNPAGSNIGTFHYAQGMKLSGELNFLFIKLDVDIDMQVNRGIKIDAQLEKIVLGTEKLFSISAEQGAGGPQLSLATFSQPSEKKEYQKPHFYINGKIEILAVSRSAFVNVSTSGAEFELSGDLIPDVVSGNLSGHFDGLKNLGVNGTLFAGIADIDLGPLGTFKIQTGVEGLAKIWSNSKNFGASIQAGFELAGNHYDLPEIALDVNTQDLTDLPELFFKAVKQLLEDLFTDPKKWAAIVSRALGWGKDEVEKVLSDVFKLDKDEIEIILKTILCPIGSALGALT